MKIEDDVLFICQRLKEIDESYYVVFNENKKRFEVHSSEQPFTSFCFSIPYKQLDERTIKLTQKSRIENRKKLIWNMDKENEKLEKRQQMQAKDLIIQQVKEQL